MYSPRIFMCEVFLLISCIFKLHKLSITNILIVFICIFSIILILQHNEKEVLLCDNGEICVSFLSKNGWIVDLESEVVENIIVSYENSASFTEYCRIQNEQGFDFNSYLNKELEKHSFSVLNYPENSEGIYANVFIYKGEIVAADICSVKLNGFIQGVIK